MQTSTLSGGVAARTRGSAISPASGLMSPDGIVIAGQPAVELAIPLTNVIDVALTDVKVSIDEGPEESSGVRVLISDVGTIVAMEPNSTHSVHLMLDTIDARPGKYWIWLLVEGVDPAGRNSISRTKVLFFIATHTHGMFDRFPAAIGNGEVDIPRIWTSVAPEGAATVEITKWAQNSRGENIPYPAAIRMGVTPATPYKGQFSPLPYSDPLWKGLGAAVAEVGGTKLVAVATGATVVGVGAGSTAAASGASKGTAIAIGIGATLLVGGVVLGMMDGEDPFLWGEAKTPVDPDEYTIREEALAEMIEFDQPMDVLPLGTKVTGWAEWTFIRVTNKRTMRVCERVRIWTDHFLPHRDVTANLTGEADRPELHVNADFAKPGTQLKGARLHCVAYAYSSDGLVVSVPLAEEMQRELPADSVRFSGIAPLPTADTSRQWEVYVFAQDINWADPDDPMLVQAESLGGVVVSAPTFDTQGTLQPDVTVQQRSADQDVISLWGDAAQG